MSLNTVIVPHFLYIYDEFPLLFDLTLGRIHRPPGVKPQFAPQAEHWQGSPWGILCPQMPCECILHVSFVAFCTVDTYIHLTLTVLQALKHLHLLTFFPDTWSKPCRDGQAWGKKKKKPFRCRHEKFPLHFQLMTHQSRATGFHPKWHTDTFAPTARPTCSSNRHLDRVRHFSTRV